MPSAQPVHVISLIWHHVSTSEGHLQASSIKYIKGIMYSCVKFWTEISTIQFDKIPIIYKKRFLFQCHHMSSQTLSNGICHRGL